MWSIPARGKYFHSLTANQAQAHAATSPIRAQASNRGVGHGVDLDHES
jgi:hypothetical protein